MKKLAVIFASALIFIILYARFIGTKGIKINEYKIVNENIVDAYHGLKIVHLSDIHYGSIVNSKKLCKIIDKINEIKPDIVVLTGDLLDQKYQYNTEEIISCLSRINARLGKYAISGNHDLPIEDYYNIIENANFINLDNKYDLIYDGTNTPIVISGISSNIIDTTDIGVKTESFNNYIKDNDVYSILLMHEPDYADYLNLDNYDLILAGHTHGRQVNIPLISNIFLPIMGKKYYNGYYRLNNTDLYVSSGLGTSGLRLRLFQKPSFNLYRITNK